MGQLERGQYRFMTLEQFRLGHEEGVAVVAYLVEQGAVQLAAVPTAVRSALQPFIDLSRRRVHQEHRAEWRNDRLPVAEGERFGSGPLIRGEDLHRVPADLDENAAVNRELGTKVLDLRP